ncbi:SOS response-associated peptidase family protein [Variovorax sp. efr-133-TYG-130]|uniref:SOS response-associated peptidase n=1 Tax=Variovorax sp. efr-133-TYG-130 TaxID=3040327 RepID=UPI002554058F|nr:SOS response-associated peptidase family protein [Variovorax sp. efr-133-TYG-130]
MCTRYISPEDREIEAAWHVGARTPERWARDMHPLYLSPFMRRARESADYERELVTGQWGLIPVFSPSHIPQTKPRKGETKGKRLSTVNARVNGIEQKPTYRNAWTKGQRCIIPARSFIEPCWETGEHVPWNFRRADGQLWGLAGLWDTWTDFETGEVWDSYTMLTLNANLHPLMSRMHKLEFDSKTKMPLPIQDKRSLVPLEAHDFDRWLTCTVEEARAMLELPSVALFDAAPLAVQQP